MPSNESDIRNSALEEAAQVVDRFVNLCDDIIIRGRSVKAEKQALLRDVARAIRAIAPPEAITASKPFTFAEPAAQRDHERIRAESRKRRERE